MTSAPHCPPSSLQWTFQLTVPSTKLKDATAALTSLQKSIWQNNSRLTLSVSLSSTQVSLQQTPRCHLADLSPGRAPRCSRPLAALNVRSTVPGLRADSVVRRERHSVPGPQLRTAPRPGAVASTRRKAAGVALQRRPPFLPTRKPRGAGRRVAGLGGQARQFCAALWQRNRRSPFLPPRLLGGEAGGGTPVQLPQLSSGQRPGCRFVVLSLT